MLYSDIQTVIQGILNRRDLTPTLLNTFITMGIQRIQRVLRIPAMENILVYSTDGTPTIPVPNDLLEIISIAFNDDVNQQKLVRVDQQTAMRLSNIPGIPTSYYRQRGNFAIGPCPPAGTYCYVTYYQDASGLVNPTDHNWITDASPDLLIYAALGYAADYYLDDRKQSFEQRYSQILSDLQGMADDDELLNASIGSAYSDYSPIGYY